VECDVQRPESATVVKNNLQIVKDMVTEKIGMEVSREANSQKVAVEKIDVEKYLACEDHQTIDQWEPLLSKGTNNKRAN
jgi:hypothetical protein